LKAGDRLPLTPGINDFSLRQPVGRLAKIYIEPTNRCNLNCRTCIRNIWDEPLGQMTGRTFKKVVRGIKAVTPRPQVIFGGLGEPLSHPDIAVMIQQVKQQGCPVELITNATLLNGGLAEALITAGLDVLWVSIDGARPESYADVRLGAELPAVIENIARVRDMRQGAQPHIGIVFVAMRKNINELPEVVSLGRRLGADRFLVTNVLPYTEDMAGEILYTDILNTATVAAPSALAPRLHFCRMDLHEGTVNPLYRVIRGWRVANYEGDASVGDRNYCPFVESGSIAIAWDGNASPCMPLMHTHASFLNDRRRTSERFVVGNINEHTLPALWKNPDYVAFREAVKAFDFSPCTLCGGCRLSHTNQEDCLGNLFPTCGGCLWAQGVIRCP
jgi:MoaA/NifB/PqqE/SkfB family radical SAM enzyme